MAKERKPSKKKEAPVKSGKRDRLFNNLLKTTQQFMQGRSFVPVTQTELMERLHLPELHADIFSEIMHALVSQGLVEVNKGRYSCKQAASDMTTGTLRLHPRGFGFVKPENASADTQDIFIPKHLTQNAVDGDTVEVLINNESVSEKGPEGRIVSIISRSRTHLAGIVREINRNGFPIAYAPMLGIAQRIVVETEGNSALTIGDRIVMKVVEWGTKDSPTICQLSHRLGHISDPSCDIDAAIEEYELRKDFPAKAVEEAQQFGRSVPTKEIKNREDLRKLTCFTIDPDTAKDFDDAVSLSKDSDGHYHLGVHIADVSHYVRPGSALDAEAQLRCNSTYFPGYCLPMLPRELSDNLCSLKANVNRLTASVLMHIDSQGNVLSHRIVRSIIKSTKRFTYREAKEVLDGKTKSIHKDTLHLMVELCGLLKRKRYERGSVEFALPDLVVVVDEKGAPVKTDYIEYDITHQLVEEFMLKANEMVAWHISQSGKNMTYRIHDEPSEDNMKDFALLAGIFGYKLSEKPTPKEIQKLFDEAMSTSYGQYLATCYIRRMRLAVYSADNIGHYGLSLTHYCHFTSPIRRYIDLVVHRTLFLEGDEKEKLEMVASRCSEQERISSKAENSVVLLKKLRMLDDTARKNPQKQFDAVITRVKNFGIYFEILDLMLESYLHVSELDNDFYIYEDNTNALRGRRYGKIYHAGSKITIMLKEVDFVTLDSKWFLVAEQDLKQSPQAPVPKRRGKERPLKQSEPKKSTGRKVKKAETKGTAKKTRK
jgi:ribonuclease R